MPTTLTETPPQSLETGPWTVASAPEGWDWLPGYGLYEQTDAAARLNLIYTWDQLGEAADLMAYVERQKEALATLVSDITTLGAEAVKAAGYDQSLHLGLVLNRDSPEEVWQEQLYLRLGDTIGILTASGPAAQRDRLRAALRLGLKVASFSQD